MGAVVAVIAAVLLLIGTCAGYPRWNVYQQEMKGRAMLRQAESEKKILVTQAQAEADAAKLRAQAIAEVGKAAQEFPEYREQEFIGSFAEALHQGKIQQIIYVPTERNIPIVEYPHDRMGKK
jgi:regulator of protease activity HflC (stomatin/prohibitin superfamily)